MSAEIDKAYSDLAAGADEAIGLLLEMRELAASDPTFDVPSLWDICGGNGRLLAALERRLERAVARDGTMGEGVMAGPKKWTPAEIEKRAKEAHQKWLVNMGYKPGPAPSPTAKSAPLEAKRNQAVNELERVLARTPHGRQMLDLLADAAKWRLHEQLAAELVTSARNRVDSLRHELVTTRDPLAQHKAAAQIPQAEIEFAKWSRALADFKHRREYVEYTIRDGMRAFA